MTTNTTSRRTRTALILGASRGIGLETVKQYRADGWRVIATVRSQEAAQALQALGAETHVLDLTDARVCQLNKAALKFVEQVERIDAAAKERTGKRPHEDELGDAQVVLLAFEAERLSGKEPERKRPRGARKPPRASARS